LSDFDGVKEEEEEESEQLIVELRAMLRETGFVWTAEQAEASFPGHSWTWATAR